MIILFHNWTDGMDSAYARIWNRRSLSKITHNSLSPEGKILSAAGGWGGSFSANKNDSYNKNNVPFTSQCKGKHSSFAGPDVD